MLQIYSYRITQQSTSCRYAGITPQVYLVEHYVAYIQVYVLLPDFAAEQRDVSVSSVSGYWYLPNTSGVFLFICSNFFAQEEQYLYLSTATNSHIRTLSVFFSSRDGAIK
jgi:hypothetical protein